MAGHVCWAGNVWNMIFDERCQSEAERSCGQQGQFSRRQWDAGVGLPCQLPFFPAPWSVKSNKLKSALKRLFTRRVLYLSLLPRPLQQNPSLSQHWHRGPMRSAARRRGQAWCVWGTSEWPGQSEHREINRGEVRGPRWTDCSEYTGLYAKQTP